MFWNDKWFSLFVKILYCSYLPSLHALSILPLCFSYSFICLFHIFQHSDESLTPTISFVSFLTLLFNLFYFPSFSGQLRLSIYCFMFFFCPSPPQSFSLPFVQLLSVCRIISFFPSFCHASALSVPLSVPGKRFCVFAHVTTDNIWVIALVNHRWSLVFIFPRGPNVSFYHTC